jgi:hypothetical protein
LEQQEREREREREMIFMFLMAVNMTPCSLVHLFAAWVVYSSILKTAAERCSVMSVNLSQMYGVISQKLASTLQPVHAQP